jgi:hypothetical protein
VSLTVNIPSGLVVTSYPRNRSSRERTARAYAVNRSDESIPRYDPPIPESSNRGTVAPVPAPTSMISGSEGSNS